MAKHDNNLYLDAKTHLCRKFDDTRGIIMIPGWKAPKLVRLDFVQALNQFIDVMVNSHGYGPKTDREYAHSAIEHAAQWLFNKGFSDLYGQEVPGWVPAYVHSIVKRDWTDQ